MKPDRILFILFRILQLKTESTCLYKQNFGSLAGEYAKHFHSVDPLKCSEEEDWLSLFNGTIYIDPGIKKTHGGISCSITFFDRIDDFRNKDLKNLYFSDETKLPLLSDYFKAKKLEIFFYCQDINMFASCNTHVLPLHRTVLNSDR
jgi:hypothetical protein